MVGSFFIIVQVPMTGASTRENAVLFGSGGFELLEALLRSLGHAEQSQCAELRMANYEVLPACLEETVLSELF